MNNNKLRLYKIIEKTSKYWSADSCRLLYIFYGIYVTRKKHSLFFFSISGAEKMFFSFIQYCFNQRRKKLEIIL